MRNCMIFSITYSNQEIVENSHSAVLTLIFRLIHNFASHFIKCNKQTSF